MKRLEPLLSFTLLLSLALLPCCSGTGSIEPRALAPLEARERPLLVEKSREERARFRAALEERLRSQPISDEDLLLRIIDAFEDAEDVPVEALSASCSLDQGGVLPQSSEPAAAGARPWPLRSTQRRFRPRRPSLSAPHDAARESLRTRGRSFITGAGELSGAAFLLLFVWMAAHGVIIAG